MKQLMSTDEREIVEHANSIKDKLVRRRSLGGSPATGKFRSATLRFRGNYTVVMLDNKYLGIAKFNPNDFELDPLVGAHVATYRAVLDDLGIED
jgi:hypothetical protein